jgi:signal transduction histidine kinase
VIARDRTGRLLSYGGIGILLLIEYSAVRRHPAALAATAITTAVVIGAWVLWWSTLKSDLRIRFAILAVMGIGTIGLAIASPDGAAIIPAVVATAAASRMPSVAGQVYAAALISGFVIATGYVIGWLPVPLLSYGVGLAFTFLAARSTARLRDEQRRTQQLLAELQQSRDAQVQAAALNERSRIARDIHDVLAHTLSALTVQLEGARMMLDQRHSDPEALAAVERALKLSREGLDETKSAVSALRGDQVPGTDELTRLVADFQRDSATPARLEVQGTPHELPSEAQLALYRTAQEALTNIRKHATRPARVEVSLRYEPVSTQLLIRDRGAPPNGVVPGGGYGLIGMRERAELLGGTLEAHPTDDGFMVALRLPV